jgi:hypothetical protein
MLLRNTYRAFRHRDCFIFWCGLFLGHRERWSKPPRIAGSFFSSLTRRFTWAWRGRRFARHFLLSLFFLFFAGGFQTTFLSSVATLLQIQSAETNRGRMMSLFGLIKSRPRSHGKFPFRFGCCSHWCALDGGNLRVYYCGPDRLPNLLSIRLAYCQTNRRSLVFL